MKQVFVLLIFLSVVSPLFASQPACGFYLRVGEETSDFMMSSNDQEFHIGRKEELEVLKSEMFFRNNANTIFYLSVTIPYDENIWPWTYILIVDSIAYRQVFLSSFEEETSKLRFKIEGKEEAEKVSEYLNASVEYRKHPGHNLLASFIPVKPEFHTGEKVTVTFRIKNVGDNSIMFKRGGRYRGVRDNQYVFSALYMDEQVEDIGTSAHFGGLMGQILLEPGDVFEEVVSLSKWFAFDIAGFYQVLGAYYLEFTDPDSGEWRTIWEDYASEDFLITIKEIDETVVFRIDIPMSDKPENEPGYRVVRYVVHESGFVYQVFNDYGFEWEHFAWLQRKLTESQLAGARSIVDSLPDYRSELPGTKTVSVVRISDDAEKKKVYERESLPWKMKELFKLLGGVDDALRENFNFEEMSR